MFITTAIVAITKNCEKIYLFFLGFLSNYRYAYFLRFGIESYLDVYFSSVLNINYLSWDNYVAVYSSISGIIFAIVYSSFPVIIIWAIHYIRPGIMNGNKVVRKRWGVIFDSLNIFRPASLYFNIFFLVRRVIYILSIHYIKLYPTAQLSFFLFGSFTMLSY